MPKPTLTDMLRAVHDEGVKRLQAEETCENCASIWGSFAILAEAILKQRGEWREEPK